MRKLRINSVQRSGTNLLRIQLRINFDIAHTFAHSLYYCAYILRIELNAQ